METKTLQANKSLEGKHLSFSRTNNAKHILEVLQDTSLAIKDGEFKSIIGPSGCGKSTLLNILSGLLKPDQGVVYLNDEKLDDITEKLGLPTPSDVGVVFQDYGLFPWLTVYKNVGFGLRMQGMAKKESDKRVENILRKVGLWDFRDHFPHQLSGGMKQRTSIARVLATDAEFLLMDEPFSSLDFQTRRMMQEFLLDIWKKFNKTIIYVSHDIDEVLCLSDKVYLMSAYPGRIEEEIIIDVPRPRVASDPRLVPYRAHITEHLEREVKKIFASQAVI